jgi:CheY-like chemotaxis protein/two-component sensor histidine kinase
MEAMGQLTGGVAHDFNNLLTPIVACLDILQRRGVGSEREKPLIVGAAQAADRAATLVQRLLAFARRQPLQASAVDLARLVRDMADLVASTTGPQIEVIVDIAEPLPPALADPNQLEMALLNLSVNARDAMPEGGRLRIAAQVEAGSGQGKARGRGAGFVRLSVADTGTGMDAATLARAVEPFFSTKGVGKGTGLGLSMVHGLVAQLGGRLEIASVLGEGTTIHLLLPIAAAGQEPVRDEPAGEADSGGGAGTALLVDDEPLVRATTADLLGELGFAVVEAASAEAALQLIAKGLRPDLVVTDHLMPGMSGTELARRIQQGVAEARVLLVSGYAEVEDLAPDLPRLAKPFRRSELSKAIGALTRG